MGRLTKISPMAFAAAYSLVIPLAVGLLVANVGFDQVKDWLGPLLQVAAILASAGIAVGVPRASRRAENLRFEEKAHSLAILLKATVRTAGVKAGVIEKDPDLDPHSYDAATYRLNLDVINEAFASFPAERLPSMAMQHFLMLAGLAANSAKFMQRRAALHGKELHIFSTFNDGEFAILSTLIEEHKEALALALGRN